MAERPCSIEGCVGKAGIPGSGRGMCNAHYKKLRKYGDPLHVVRRRNVCSVDECGKLVFSKSWCSMHYSRWARHGSPTFRLPGEVRDDKRICPMCEIDKELREYSQKGSYCRPCTTERMRLHRLESPQATVGKTPKDCEECGVLFPSDRRSSRFCSAPCSRAGKRRWDREHPPSSARRSAANRRWRLRHPERGWAKSAAYRARRKAATVETVYRGHVFRRDGWICQLCLGAIDPKVAWPDPKSASVDHRLPLAAGGEHSMANCQAAHLDCNIRKGAAILSGGALSRTAP